MEDQSDAGNTGIFSWRTNRTQETRAYSHGGPIRRVSQDMPFRRRNLFIPVYTPVAMPLDHSTGDIDFSSPVTHLLQARVGLVLAGLLENGKVKPARGVESNRSALAAAARAGRSLAIVVPDVLLR
eukprot:1179719-Prorocentrum_minimum.AAC.1